MNTRQWTTDPRQIVSEFAIFKKTNVFHVHQLTQIQASNNTLHILFNTPQVKALVEAFPVEETNEWQVKIWFINQIFLNDIDMMHLALYATKHSLDPHYNGTISPPQPFSSSTTLETPTQLAFEEDAYSEPWGEVFSAFEKIATEEYKKFFFHQFLTVNPKMKIEHIQIDVVDNKSLNMRLFALQESSTFILKIYDDNIVLRLGTLLGKDETTEYSINYSPSKTADGYEETSIYNDISEIFSSTKIGIQSINNIFIHAVQEAKKIKEKHEVKNIV